MQLTCNFLKAQAQQPEAVQERRIECKGNGPRCLAFSFSDTSASAMRSLSSSRKRAKLQGSTLHTTYGCRSHFVFFLQLEPSLAIFVCFPASHLLYSASPTLFNVTCLHMLVSRSCCALEILAVCL